MEIKKQTEQTFTSSTKTLTQRHVDTKPIIGCQSFPKPEGQVIVHIIFQTCYSFCTSCKIMIRQGISLIPHSGTAKSNLVHIENVDRLDTSLPVKAGINRFTLIFEALPNTSRNFDFVEPGKDGWLVKGIKRNDSDVYTLKIHDKEIKVIE